MTIQRSEELVEALRIGMIVWFVAEVPFADECRAITYLLQHFSDGYFFFGKSVFGARTYRYGQIKTGGITPGQQRRTGGRWGWVTLPESWWL